MDVNYSNECDDPGVSMIEDRGAIVRLSLNADCRPLKPNGCSKESPRVYIEFSDLRYTLPTCGKGKRKDILHCVSGCIRPGRLMVILGPSGAGKTSLLSILSSTGTSKVKGSITINGEKLNRDAIRRESCYIPQEFALQPLLTTRETLYIAARLKLGRGRFVRKPDAVVEEIAEGLGLTNCLDTLAGALSGGERKRLSIGVEIVTKPSVMLLDEPTSGLDSAASNQVIGLLHSMAQAGCTVACAVHQPSSQMIAQFDDVLVLSHGRSMYCGPMNDILSTFSCAGYTCPQFYNIAEFVLEVITEQRGGDLTRLCNISFEKYLKWKTQNDYLNHPAAQPKEDKEYFEKGNTEDPRPLSIWQEQRVLFLRSWICMKRDNTLTKLRFVAHIVIALLLGAVFYDFGNDAAKVNSNIACIFFFLLFLFFANSMPAVQIFPTETAVFLREHLNNWYNLHSYYVVKVLSDLPLQIICPTSFILISYYMTGQPMEADRVLRAWAVCVLLTILGQTVGIATGAAFNTELGIFLIPALSIPMLLFAGFFLKLGEMAVYFQPLGSLSFFRYAFEGMMQAIYDGNRGPLRCDEIYCILNSPKKILAQIGMPSLPFHTIIIVLCSWIVSLHLIVYLILRWRLHWASK